MLLDLVHRYSDAPPDANDLPSGKVRLFWNDDNEDISAYEGRRKEVFEAAKKVCDTYDELVLTARRKFALNKEALNGMRVDATTRPSAMPELPDSELPTFHNTRRQFMELSFSQKWALKKVLQSPGQRYPDLLASLSTMGFAHVDTDVGQLFCRSLAEQQLDGSVVPNTWAIKFGERLFKEFPLS